MSANGRYWQCITTADPKARASSRQVGGLRCGDVPMYKSAMIVELRTYTVHPGTVPVVEDHIGLAIPNRVKLSPLAGAWHTEIGPLNRLIQLWPYNTIEERLLIRAASRMVEGWPPSIGEFVLEQTSRILIPASFSPKLTPRRLGEIYKIQIEKLRYGSRIHAYSGGTAVHIEDSTLVFAGYSESDRGSLWCSIFAYGNIAELAAASAQRRRGTSRLVRDETSSTILSQECMLLVPSWFSPLQ
jgi:hypothetical protein